MQHNTTMKAGLSSPSTLSLANQARPAAASFHQQNSAASTSTEEPEPYREPVHVCPAPIDAPKEASQILPFLWLGSLENANDPQFLSQNQITHVLNVCTFEEKSDLIPPENYLNISILDSFDAKVGHHLPAANSFLRAAYDLYEDTNGRNGTTLIHCHSGISRAATFTVAFIMVHKKFGWERALSYVRQRRAHINPNLNFCGQLTQYEKHLVAQNQIPAPEPAVIAASQLNHVRRMNENLGISLAEVASKEPIVNSNNSQPNKTSTMETDASLRTKSNRPRRRPNFLKLSSHFLCMRDSNSSISNDHRDENLSLLSNSNTMTARDRAGLGSTLNLKLCCVPTKSKSHQHQNQDSPVSEKSNSSSQTPTGSNRVALEQRPIAVDMVQPARPLPRAPLLAPDVGHQRLPGTGRSG